MRSMLRRRTDRDAARSLSGTTLLVILALLGTALMVVAIFTISTNDNDREAVARQTALVSRILAEQRELLAQEQQDMSVWTLAYKAVSGPQIDLAFVEANLGLGAYQYFGHDAAFVIDPRSRPVYAMLDGKSVPSEAFLSFAPAFAPLIERLREVNWRGAMGAYANGISSAPPSVSDLLRFNGTPAMVNLMPVVSDQGGEQPGPGREFIHISVQYLDADIAERINDMLVMDGGRFELPGTALSGKETALQLRDGAQQPVAQFVWTPYRPSDYVMEKTVPLLAFVLVFASVAITILTMRLRNSNRELAAGRSEAQHMAYHDALTGLGNRLRFEHDLERAVRLLGRTPEAQIALLLLDLDRFKQVNDTLGHDAGDELICQVAERLGPLVRASDSIVRLGGDEFGIIAQNITCQEDVAALSKRILAAIRQPFHLQAGKAFVGVSIGIALTSDHNANSAELTREADIALYEAKGSGRNQYRIFAEHMNQAVQERQKMESDLRAALRTDGQIDVRFEPIVREKDGAIVAMAARIQWYHPERGFVSPVKFMPVAESCGLAEIIGDFILHRACEMGAKNPERKMVVRVNSVLLRNPDFFEKVRTTLDQTGLPADCLEIEVNEKALSSGEEHIVLNLRKLRKAGIHIALGDFGTGFTSLRLLQEFEVDRIKMDSTFIAELEKSPDPEATTHAVIWLARAIGVEVSAEGIDTVEQKRFLARMGCSSFQGGLCPPEAQVELLRNTIKEHAQASGEEDRMADIELWDTGT